jgi:C4-dicarboxylate transporter
MENSHHHDLINVMNSDSSAFFLTEMHVMWILMIIMFAWMYFMQIRHNKFKKLFDEVVNCEKCKFADKYNT